MVSAIALTAASVSRAPPMYSVFSFFSPTNFFTPSSVNVLGSDSSSSAAKVLMVSALLSVMRMLPDSVSDLRFLRSFSSATPASVTPVLPRVSFSSAVSWPTCFMPASPICSLKNTTSVLRLLSALSSLSPSLVTFLLAAQKLTPLTGLPGAVSSRVNLPPTLSTHLTVAPSASSAEAAHPNTDTANASTHRHRMTRPSKRM